MWMGCALSREVSGSHQVDLTLRPSDQHMDGNIPSIHLHSTSPLFVVSLRESVV